MTLNLYHSLRPLLVTLSTRVACSVPRDGSGRGAGAGATCIFMSARLSTLGFGSQDKPSPVADPMVSQLWKAAFYLETISCSSICDRCVRCSREPTVWNKGCSVIPQLTSWSGSLRECGRTTHQSLGRLRRMNDQWPFENTAGKVTALSSDASDL